MPAKPKKSASAKKPSGKPLSAAAEAFIKNKAAKSKYTPGQLRAIYKRGQGTYLSSGSRNVSMDAWARGRVNAAVKGKATVMKADGDILKKKRKA